MDWLLHPGSEGADAEHQCATTMSSAGRMLHRSRFALRSRGAGNAKHKATADQSDFCLGWLWLLRGAAPCTRL